MADGVFSTLRPAAGSSATIPDVARNITDAATTNISAMVRTEGSPTGRFFDFPPEIRNAIYGYALREDSKVLPGTGKEPSLFAACHQMRKEALQMFYFINDLEFYIWPSQIWQSQSPAYRWAYYHIGGNTLKVGQSVTLKTDRFQLELQQTEVNGKVGLELKDLFGVYKYVTPGSYARFSFSAETRKSITYALDFVFRNEDLDMTSWLAHNVVRGLVQYIAKRRNYALAADNEKETGALEFIGGTLPCGGERKSFFEVW
ncbi:hypothetical protein LTR36_005561 [Oleoguttula mirabilis]|uniref:Uncharacterized protein n=1 Tax=Oleoguttula mirabilis TaxID=1507867 RepID=A0AAV9JFY2_9PEZI|nr:hypothetical protein LTR36_005561 [Oleoguttula mirabilis]